jgi:hypothetical protein
VKPTKTSSSTFKQCLNSHGVPGEIVFVVYVVKFEWEYLQVDQPQTLFFIMFTVPSLQHQVSNTYL